MQPLHITLIPLARPTFDIPLAQQVTDTITARLQDAGFILSSPAALVMDLDAANAAATDLKQNPPDLLLVLQATFADSSMIQAIAAATDAPLLMWAVPESPTGGRLRLNALCGINLGGHALNLQGRKYAYAYAQPEDTAVLTQIRNLALAGRAKRQLQHAKMGIVGDHPAGMDTCHLDAQLLKNTFGVESERFDLDTMFARVNAVPSAQVDAIAAELNRKLPNLNELAQPPLRGTVSTYAALTKLATEKNLNGFAIRCWPEFFESQGCAACGAMSLLNDDLLPGSCEADANGTVTQLMLQSISESPTFDVDVVSVDAEADQVVVWHCGKAPLSMADPAATVEGGIHSNRKVPLVMEFPLKPGRITVARVSQANGRLTLVVGGGEMLAAPKSFTGTSGVVRFDSPAKDVLDTILSKGLEHHLAITYGDFVPALVALAELLDLPLLKLS